MASVFDGAIDTFNTLVDNVDTVVAADWNALADAIVAIEEALGINLASVVGVGEIKMWAGSVGTIPSGWVHCDGAAVSRTTFARLFAVIGTHYGSGDGSTTFNLPNTADIFPVGTKQDSGGVAKSNLEGSLNKTGGSLTTPETTGTATATGAIEGGPNDLIQTHSHTFTPPFLAVVYMIRF